MNDDSFESENLHQQVSATERHVHPSKWLIALALFVVLVVVGVSVAFGDLSFPLTVGGLVAALGILLGAARQKRQG